MKLLFVTGLYTDNARCELNQISPHIPLQEAPNSFQWAIINGLYANGIDFNVLSFPFLPSYPFGCYKRMTPSSVIKYEDRIIGEMLSYDSFFLLKQNSIERLLYENVKIWIKNHSFTQKDNFCILTYTQSSFFISPLLKLKKEYPGLIIATIITDMIEDALNYKSNRSYFKRLQLFIEAQRQKKQFKYIDKYILLTKAMEERIPEANNKNIVVEGICNVNQENFSIVPKAKMLFYSGTLESYSGIKELVDAFMMVKMPDIKLCVCGSGILSNYIQEKMKVDERIYYLGNLPRNRVIELQRKSSILINPRRPDNGITRFSFPSKTMEYMVSGTPMIGYKLEGIPEEYYINMFVPNDLSIQSLANCIKDIFLLPNSILVEKAKGAYKFVTEKKNAEIQVKKIMDFICL